MINVRPEDRSLLAAILKAEPSARRCWARLRALRCSRIRPDAFPHEYPPTVWGGPCLDGAIWVAMVRHGDDDWSLHS